jgi:hypothetical protein
VTHDATARAQEILVRRGIPDPSPGTKKEEATLPAPPPAAQSAMFHGILGDLVHAADPTTEADPAGVLASLLAGTGVAIGPSPYVQVGNTRHPLLIWPLLFGRTGAGRKGEATDTGEMFLRHAVPEYNDISVTGLSTGEGLIERIRDPDPDNERDEGGTHDKRLCVTETEFSTVMARAKREGSTLGTVLRQAWDGRTLAVLTRVAYLASGPHVAIIGHITPKEFRMRFAEADMVGGSYNRFLPVYVERSKKLPIPEGTPYPLLAALAERLRKAIAAARKVTRLHLDADAVQLWTDELYEEFTAADDEDHAWTEFTRRSAPYCLRVAALYAALDGPGSEGLSRTDISALFSRNVPKRELDELVARVLGHEEYEEHTGQTGGRPARRIHRRLSVQPRWIPGASSPFE